MSEGKLGRLKVLAMEPDRLPMPKHRVWPSSHGKFIDQKREIAILREALAEAVAMIEPVEKVLPDLRNLLVWAELYFAYEGNHVNDEILDRLDAAFDYRSSE